MQLDHAVGGDAGRLVQPVNVLRDDGRHLALRHQRAQGHMAAARARVLIKIVHGELAPPRLAPRLSAVQKSLERNGLVPYPRAAGRTEVGHTAFGRYAGPVKPAIIFASANRERRSAEESGGTFMRIVVMNHILDGERMGKDRVPTRPPPRQPKALSD